MGNEGHLKITTRSAIKSTIVGIVVNVILASIKGVAGVVGNSYALIADAIESTSDILTSFVVFMGLNIATREPDEDHPYGHGKAEPLAAIVVGLILISAAIIISIQSIRLIVTPHQSPAPFTLWILIGVVITKELLFRYVIGVGEEVSSTALKAEAWHHRSDALTSAAAFIGILITLLGGKGYESADDWAALFAAGIIVFNAVKILSPAIGEIMDMAPPSQIEQDVREVAANVEGVLGLDKCFVRKMGFNFYVDIHVEVDGDISVKEGHIIAHKVKDTLKASNHLITDVLVHIEPKEAMAPRIHSNRISP